MDKGKENHGIEPSATPSEGGSMSVVYTSPRRGATLMSASIDEQVSSWYAPSRADYTGSDIIPPEDIERVEPQEVDPAKADPYSHLSEEERWKAMKSDMKVQAITGAATGAIVAAIGYYGAKKSGLPAGKAWREAAKAAAVTSASVMARGPVNPETFAAEAGVRGAQAAAKNSSSSIKAAVNSHTFKTVVAQAAAAIAGKYIMSHMGKRVIHNSAKLNAVTNVAMFVASTVPDTMKFYRGEMTRGNYAETMAYNAADFGGSWIGASAGAAIGSAICPGAGTVIGGIVGGIGGGLGASNVSQRVSDYVKTKQQKK